jgi:hypothetical protein
VGCSPDFLLWALSSIWSPSCSGLVFLRITTLLLVRLVDSATWAGFFPTASLAALQAVQSSQLPVRYRNLNSRFSLSPGAVSGSANLGELNFSSPGTRLLAGQGDASQQPASSGD